MWILSLIEGLEVLPDLLYIYLGGVGCRCGRMPIPTFQYGIRSMGSAPPVEGSIHAPISVAASYACLQESAIRDWRKALVIPLTTFRLWRDFCCKEKRLSINRMEYGDIQRG